MKIFIYKTIFILISIYVLFEFTIGHQIRKFENKINLITSKENIYKVKEKVKKEMKDSLNKDRILDKEEAEIIKKFLEKIKKEIN
jgi:hypothetical protein